MSTQTSTFVLTAWPTVVDRSVPAFAPTHRGGVEGSVAQVAVRCDRRLPRAATRVVIRVRDGRLRTAPAQLTSTDPTAASPRKPRGP